MPPRARLGGSRVGDGPVSHKGPSLLAGVVVLLVFATIPLATPAAAAPVSGNAIRIARSEGMTVRINITWMSPPSLVRVALRVCFTERWNDERAQEIVVAESAQLCYPWIVNVLARQRYLQLQLVNLPIGMYGVRANDTRLVFIDQFFSVTPAALCNGLGGSFDCTAGVSYIGERPSGLLPPSTVELLPDRLARVDEGAAAAGPDSPGLLPEPGPPQTVVVTQGVPTAAVIGAAAGGAAVAAVAVGCCAFCYIQRRRKQRRSTTVRVVFDDSGREMIRIEGGPQTVDGASPISVTPDGQLVIRTNARAQVPAPAPPAGGAPAAGPSRRGTNPTEPAPRSPAPSFPRSASAPGLQQLQQLQGQGQGGYMELPSASSPAPRAGGPKRSPSVAGPAAAVGRFSASFLPSPDSSAFQRAICTKCARACAGVPDEEEALEAECPSCRLPLVIKKRFWPVSRVGGGEFGTAFLAVDLHYPSRRQCVVKKFTFFEKSGNEEHIEKAAELFLEEGRVLENLDHPCVPKLLGSFLWQGDLYNVMNFVPGRDLQRIMKDRSGTYPESEVYRLLDDMTDALSYVHARRILHRDVKPSNIIAGDDGDYYLVDFGLSTTSRPDWEQATMIGTYAYSDPEQRRGYPTPSSDLYSLAATCVELLTRARPTYEYFCDWTPPARLPISSHLASVLSRMLRRDPAQRFESAAAAREALFGRDCRRRRSVPPQHLAAPDSPANAPLRPASSAPPAALLPPKGDDGGYPNGDEAFYVMPPGTGPRQASSAPSHVPPRAYVLRTVSTPRSGRPPPAPSAGATRGSPAPLLCNPTRGGPPPPRPPPPRGSPPPPSPPPRPRPAAAAAGRPTASPAPPPPPAGPSPPTSGPLPQPATPRPGSGPLREASPGASSSALSSSLRSSERREERSVIWDLLSTASRLAAGFDGEAPTSPEGTLQTASSAPSSRPLAPLLRRTRPAAAPGARERLGAQQPNAAPRRRSGGGRRRAGAGAGAGPGEAGGAGGAGARGGAQAGAPSGEGRSSASRSSASDRTAHGGSDSGEVPRPSSLCPAPRPATDAAPAAAGPAAAAERAAAEQRGSSSGEGVAAALHRWATRRRNHAARKRKEGPAAAPQGPPAPSAPAASSAPPAGAPEAPQAGGTDAAAGAAPSSARSEGLGGSSRSVPGASEAGGNPAAGPSRKPSSASLHSH
eukprot:tig00021038_g17581.t1